MPPDGEKHFPCGPGDELRLAATFRDFISIPESGAVRHPDFEMCATWDSSSKCRDKTGFYQACLANKEGSGNTYHDLYGDFDLPAGCAVDDCKADECQYDGIATSSVGQGKSMVQNTLGSDNLPQYRDNSQDGRHSIHSAATFQEWYRDTPGVNKKNVC
jgi:hypothetical protein